MIFNKFARLVLTAIVLFCTVTFSFAQMSGGGRLGINFANLRGESVKDNSMIIGYNVGGFLNYSMKEFMSGDIADILSFQAEMTLQSKGANAEYATLDSNEDTETFIAKQLFTYVEIPVIAKFSFTPGKKFTYFGEGGLFLGALVGVTIDGEKSWNHDLDKSTDPRKYREEYSGFDAGVLFGGGASMPFGGRNSPWAAFANLRYTLGLMNIGQEKDKTPEVLKPYLQSVKTNTLSLVFGVSYMF